MQIMKLLAEFQLVGTVQVLDPVTVMKFVTAVRGPSGRLWFKPPTKPGSSN
jgi:hypothetical protein